MNTRAFSSFLHLLCCVVDGTILLNAPGSGLLSVLTRLGVNIIGGSLFTGSLCECGAGFLKRNWLASAEWGPQSSQEAENCGALQVFSLFYLASNDSILVNVSITQLCVMLIFPQVLFATINFRGTWSLPPPLVEKVQRRTQEWVLGRRTKPGRLDSS